MRFNTKFTSKFLPYVRKKFWCLSRTCGSICRCLFEASERAELIEEIKVHYRDIDINRHVNNVKYLKWLIDAFPSETLTEKPISELEINFLHELKLNEQIQIFQELDDDNHMSCKITSETTGKENCRARIVFNSIN